jgi:hypothetical protein
LELALRKLAADVKPMTTSMTSTMMSDAPCLRAKLN